MEKLFLGLRIKARPRRRSYGLNEAPWTSEKRRAMRDQRTEGRAEVKGEIKKPRR